MKINDEITERIIKCCFVVHNALGPGYCEKIYQNALQIELADNNIKYATEKTFKVCYKGKWGY